MMADWLMVVAPLSLVLLLAGMFFALDAIMTGRTPQGTIAWVVALVFMPPVAIPLYLVFGTRRFAGYVRSRRRGRLEINSLGRTVLAALTPHAVTSGPLGGMAFERVGAMPPTQGNSVDLLIDGGPTFDSIFAAIDNATSYLLVQFYIIHDDDLGKNLEARLKAALARGVSVRVLYDEIGSPGLARWSRSLIGSGAEVRAFKRSKAPRNRYRMNFRNHRKIVVADGIVAFIGGHNVGDEYLGKVPERAPWRDTHIAVRGPAVQSIQLAFCEDWYWATKSVPELNWTPLPVNANLPVAIVASGPVDEVDSATLTFLAVMTSARSRLWIATPYFAPDEAICSALQLAAMRGVDVHILVPAVTDHRLVNWAHETYFDQMLLAGVHIHVFSPGFMHQKVVLADNVVTVGTANIDNRSLRINFEITAVTTDPSLASQVHDMLAKDFRTSQLLTKQDLARRPAWKRLRARIARLCAPLL